MKTLLTSIIVLALQRVPFLNRLPFIRDAGTIEAALRIITKAFDQLAALAETDKAVVAQIDTQVEQLAVAREAALASAERAERVRERLADLVA